MQRGLRGQTGDRKVRQEAITAPGRTMWGPGLGLELWRLVRDQLGMNAVMPTNRSPCFHLCPLRSILPIAARVILVKT